MAERLTRKEIKRDIKHDKFVEEVGSAYNYAEGHRSTIFLVVGAVVLAALAAWGYIAWKGSREDKAQLALADAIKAADAPINPPADAGPVPLSFKTEDERTTRATSLFEKVRTDYSGSEAADVAGLFLARYAMAKGDTATARKNLEEFIADHGDHLLAGGARYSIYEMRIAAGEAQTVIGELDKMLADSDTALPADAILALLGRAYDQLGNSARARDAYQRITTEFPESPYVADAQQRISSM